jgi:hypothetical protein
MPQGVILDFRHLVGSSDLGFIEPDNPTLLNLLTLIQEGQGLLVSSDLPLSDFLSDPTISLKLVSDGATVSPVGSDHITRTAIALTFTDNAASSEPDNSSTFSLLVFGLIALFLARRRAAVRTS